MSTRFYPSADGMSAMLVTEDGGVQHIEREITMTYCDGEGPEMRFVVSDGLVEITCPVPVRLTVKRFGQFLADVQARLPK